MTWKYPLVVIAVSRRMIGFVGSTGPMSIDKTFVWSMRHAQAHKRRALLREHLCAFVRECAAATVLVTHGTRWRMDEETRKTLRIGKIAPQVSVVDLADACDLMECPRKLRIVAQRIFDSYPGAYRHVKAVLAGDAAAARDERSVLSALAVAHAASVQHLIKFG